MFKINDVTLFFIKIEMAKIRTIIVDDELHARDSLKMLIQTNCPTIEIIGEANNVESAYLIIEELKPDLVFLDIHLADDNGFNIIKKIGNINFDVIFSSGHKEYGVDAFKVNAIDYLLKPVDKDDLISAVEKVILKRNGISQASSGDISLTVHVNDVVEQISSADICSLIAQQNYTQIITKNNRKYLASKSIGELEDLLLKTGNFIRIHRSTIINVKHITNYSKTIPFFINMVNGSFYEVSRRKKSEVISILKQN